MLHHTRAPLRLRRAGGGALPRACAAQGVADFYKGKTISILMGTNRAAATSAAPSASISPATFPAIPPSSWSTCRAPAA